MKIETIFNIGDEVWVISNNKLIKAKIVDHYFDNNYGRHRRPVSELLGWELDKTEIGAMMEAPIKRMENEMFRTKEELLNWLSNLT